MINRDEILKEVVFKTSRSSGPGGQNVNKVNTKVDLLFHIEHSFCFSETQKQKITQKLSNRINSEGFLKISVQETRSQLKNKYLAIEQLLTLINLSLKKEKPRVATKPTKASKLKRKADKIMNAKKKELRKKTFF